MSDEQLVDARGLLCPLPVLKLRKKLQSVPSGTSLHLPGDGSGGGGRRATFLRGNRA